MTNRRLLLVELRMGYENQKNLDFTDIRRKYIHSSDILRESDSEKRIDSDFVLIFYESTEPKDRRWISSWAMGSLKKDAVNWRSYTPKVSVIILVTVKNYRCDLCRKLLHEYQSGSDTDLGYNELFMREKKEIERIIDTR